MNLPGGEGEAAAEDSANSSAEESGPMTFDKMISDKAPTPEKGGEGDEEAEDSTDDDAADDSDTESDDSSSDDSNEEEEGEKESAKDDSKEDDGEGDEDEAKEEKLEGEEDLEGASKAAKGKTVALRLGKREFQIPHDAKFSFEKDGKTIEFSLKEAGNNLLTNREIDQKFSKLNTERRSLEREQREVTKIRIDHEELEDSIGILREAAQTRDIFSIAQATLSLFSRGNVDVAKTLFDQLISTTHNVAEMTEDQLKSFIANSQVGFENTKLKREKEKASRELQRRDQKEWLFNKIKQHGIDWDEYRERYAALKEVDKKRVERGQPTRLTDNLTYEQVAEETIKFTLATRIYTKVYKQIEKIAPSRVDDSNLINAVCELTDPSFSEKDIADIVREVTKDTAKPKVSKPKDSSKGVSKNPAKPEKAPEKKEANPKPAPKGKETRKDAEEEEGPVTFDKIVEKYS